MRGGSGRGCARGGLSARRVGGERRWASKLLGRPGIRASAEPVPQRAGRGVWQTAARASEGPEAAAAPCAGRSRRRAGGQRAGAGTQGRECRSASREDGSGGRTASVRGSLATRGSALGLRCERAPRSLSAPPAAAAAVIGWKMALGGWKS